MNLDMFCICISHDFIIQMDVSVLEHYIIWDTVLFINLHER